MTIFDIIKLDLKTFKEQDFEVTYEGENTEGRKFIDYEKTISPKILGIFDRLQIKIFSDKFDLNSKTFFSLMLFSSEGKVSVDKVKRTVVIMHRGFGRDADFNNNWSPKDIDKLKIGTFGRTWDLSIEGDSLDDITDDSYEVRVGYNTRNIASINQEFFSLFIWRANLLYDRPLENVELPPLKQSAVSITSNKSEGCFIATASYGNYDAPEVLLLRQFRDDILKKSIFGKAFIKCYYSVSPYLASIIAKSESLKKLTRTIILKPIIKIITTKR